MTEYIQLKKLEYENRQKRHNEYVSLKEKIEILRNLLQKNKNFNDPSPKKINPLMYYCIR